MEDNFFHFIHITNNHLLGPLHGETEGLDWTELEANELVLRLLSGLLREQTLSMDRLVFLHASHTHSSLHLYTGKWVKLSAQTFNQHDGCGSVGVV